MFHREKYFPIIHRTLVLYLQTKKLYYYFHLTIIEHVSVNEKPRCIISLDYEVFMHLSVYTELIGHKDDVVNFLWLSQICG